MRLVFFGPPGSGKGTYASIIAPRYGIAHVSAGDLLRETVKSGGEVGRLIASYIEQGQMVPNEIANQLVGERIQKPDCRKGFILDGYPRSLAQAQALERMSSIDAIVNLVVPDHVIIERLGVRRVCRQCGAVYNLISVKPRREGICDACGGELYQREDDKPEVVKQRLKLHREQIEPVLKYFEGKVPILNIECKEAHAPVEAMVEKILKALQTIETLKRELYES